MILDAITVTATLLTLAVGVFFVMQYQHKK